MCVESVVNQKYRWRITPSTHILHLSIHPNKQINNSRRPYLKQGGVGREEVQAPRERDADVGHGCLSSLCCGICVCVVLCYLCVSVVFLDESIDHICGRWARLLSFFKIGGGG